MQVGPAEILVILFVALLVFGPQRLPEVGRQVGSAIRELRRMQDTVRGELDSVLHPDVSPDLASPDDSTYLGDTEPGDHGTPAAIATRTGSAEIVGPDDDPALPVEAADEGDDPRFTGPSDSFI
jgi:TatA/E family protein of Tat protein translocase